MQPEGFHDSDWTASHDVTSDFVDRTLGRVLADRAEILDEAARVDEVSIPRDALEEYAAPSISADFVERTVQALESAREQSWQIAMESFSPPAPTEDFVDRTLSALRIDRSNLRLVDGERPAPVVPAPVVPDASTSRMLRAASWLAAAAILVTVGLFVFGSATNRSDDPTKTLTVGHDLSPNPWATAAMIATDELYDDLQFYPVIAGGEGE